jgi:urea transport system substrate-binding protein
LRIHASTWAHQSGSLALAASIAAIGTPMAVHAEEGPIKVGVLHSLSGTMAISETALRNVALMAIEEINDNGGVLGRQVEPVVVDPASDWPLFAERAEQLLTQDKVAAVFGCWTSVSRKAVLPVFEEHNGLLFLPCAVRGRRA